MAKVARKEEKPEVIGLQEYTGKAYVVSKTGHCLAVAEELTIEGGIVVGFKTISRAPDLPAAIIGQAQRALWKQYSGE